MIPVIPRLCALADVPDPGARGFRVGSGDWPLRIVVVHWRGKVAAYVNRCPHAGHPLDLVPDRFLTADASTLVCHSHGARFQPADGLCVAGPCAGQGLRAVPVEVCDGWICLADRFRLADYDT